MRYVLFSIAAGLFLASTARAEPPQEGTIRFFEIPSILCDTEKHLNSVVEALEDSLEKFVEQFIEFSKAEHDGKKPTCDVTSVMGKLIRIERIGFIKIEGFAAYGWRVHIKNGSTEGHFLYLESIEDAEERIKNLI